jgi:PAS domain S-box-containing protein
VKHHGSQPVRSGAAAAVSRTAGRALDSFERAWTSVWEMAQAFSLIGPDATQLLRGFARSADERLAPVAMAEDGILILDQRGVIESLNPRAEEIFGYRAQEAVGKHSGMLLVSGAGDAAALTVAGASGAGAPTLSIRPDAVGRRRDGTRFSLEITAADFALGSERRFIIVVRDVTERNRVESERRKAQARYQTLIEQLPVVTAMAALDEDIRELYVSPQVEHLLGFTQEEWLSDPVLWYHQIHPDDRDLLHEEFARGCVTGGPFKADFRALNRSGAVVWIHGEARVVRDERGCPLFIQGVAYDVSETKRAEQIMRASAEQLKASLSEKESLLKEIHHRVKNNLQVISSLLKLQAAHTREGNALEMFRESRNRIRSMALIHEKLYQSPNLARVEFGSYVRDLLGLLMRSYGAHGARITLNTRIENASMGIDVAVPLGLILNELISNCLKYAFADGRAGRITVELRPLDDATLRLVVADDGVGFPAGLDVQSAETLGMQLVRTLTEQIGGRLELLCGGGTGFAISFPGPG